MMNNIFLNGMISVCDGISRLNLNNTEIIMSPLRG